ncbi:MAG: hypothetical protein GWN84_23095 [Gammaproteobacteria bacterium]|nr:hypothetical protein [Gammaproteobacteria bacterium]NIR85495.1 hypothetical protein [Gammaproteobacteria bacterium]NIR89547.1 hypothetical protein [Gammaproteobacteria bacterium]NIU06632.1 hypothetical protein [Gammaproteobacteria bacterium]NIV53515.1 hypothetical protein [Gammaproteobacteria bacterium]
MATRAIGLLMLVLLGLSACARFDPRPIDEVALLERAKSRREGALEVTAAVPTIAEARALYGVNLAAKQLQPVWLEIRNETPQPQWLLMSGLDPEYYTPAEAAYAFRSAVAASKTVAIEQHFQALEFRNPVGPGETVSGFVLVNLDEGVKALDIDLLSRESFQAFTFIVPDPAFRADSAFVDFHALYRADEIVDYQSETELRAALEALPCCTTNKKGTAQGDPLNLVLIGDADDLFPAFVRRGWHPTEQTWSGAVWRTIKSFLAGTRYRYSPVSPLYAYGRPQDLAGQKARATIHERNHLRLWLSPMRFRGKDIWVGQISRDIGVRFTTKSPTISTHKIDPDVDEARDYLIQDLAYSQALAKLGYVSGVGAASRSARRHNLTGDPYYTDGLRAVMVFEARPRALNDLDFFDDWEVPAVLEQFGPRAVDED